MGRLRSGRLTNDHDVEVEALADALAVPLVGQIGETDVAGQFPSHNVAHVAGSLCGGFGVLGGNGLGYRACMTGYRLNRGNVNGEGLPLEGVGWEGLAAPLVAGIDVSNGRREEEERRLTHGVEYAEKLMIGE